ncbi:MAG: hypothetical protein U0228_03620 [Myxococcaceae bacterium]
MSAKCTSVVLAACGRAQVCDKPALPSPLPCVSGGDGGFVVSYRYETWRQPEARGLGCHVEHDGLALKVVIHGEVCADPEADTQQPYVAFTASCRPPPGHWTYADGVNTREIEVSDAGVTCL